MPLAPRPALLNQNLPDMKSKSAIKKDMAESKDVKKEVISSTQVVKKETDAGMKRNGPPPPVLYSDFPRPSPSTGLLSAQEVEHVWRSTTLFRLQELLQLDSIENLVESSNIHTHHIIHNITQVNKNGIVSNIDKKDRLPEWVLNAMKCLAYWPDKLDGYTYYPGLEKDVFRIVREYFESLQEPLTTFPLYDTFINVMVRAENLSGHALPRRSATCASPRRNTAEIDFPAQPPPHLTSFASVENLMLNLTMNATATSSNSNNQNSNTDCNSQHQHQQQAGSTPSSFAPGLRRLQRCMSSGSLSRVETSFGADNNAPPQTCVHVSRTSDADGRCTCASPPAKCNGYNVVFTKPQLYIEDTRGADSAGDVDAGGGGSGGGGGDSSGSKSELHTMSLGRHYLRHQHRSQSSKASPSGPYNKLSSSSTTRLNSDMESGECKYGYTVVISTTPKQRQDSEPSSHAGKSRIVQNDPSHYDKEDSNNHRPDNPPPYVPPPSYSSVRSSISSAKSLNHGSDSDSSYCSTRSTGYSPHVFGPGYVPKPSSQPCTVTIARAHGSSSSRDRAQQTQSLVNMQESYRMAVAASNRFGTPVGKALFSGVRRAGSTPELAKRGSSTGGGEEERVGGALSICLLLLPPADRRKLHLLLRLMHKMLSNPDINLEASTSKKTYLLQTLSRCIVRPAVEADFDEMLAMHTVSYMVDNYQALLTPPAALRKQIEDTIMQLRRDKTALLARASAAVVEEHKEAAVFCEQVSVEEFEAQKLTASQLALVELLEGIVKDRDMSDKDKKRRLKQFEKSYPEIYKKRFPTHASELALFPDKPRIKPPLLSRPLLRLKNLRF